MPRKRDPKAPTKDTRPCLVCGGAAQYRSRPRSIRYKQQSVEIDQPAWWCDACGEALIEGEDAKLASLAFDELRARVDKLPLSASAVRALREEIGLSQRKAGELLGGGPRAFQKYESGATRISHGMARLLSLVATHKELIDQLPTADDILRIRRAHADGRLFRIIERIQKIPEPGSG